METMLVGGEVVSEEQLRNNHPQEQNPGAAVLRPYTSRGPPRAYIDLMSQYAHGGLHRRLIRCLVASKHPMAACGRLG